MNQGPILALLAATLFGVSPALCKLVVGEMSPALLAGLLYLGSGIGLQVALLFQRKNSLIELKRLSKNHRIKLFWATITGGVLAPLCLAYGITLASAFEVTLLLNFETVATTVIAALVFHEHVSKRVWAGKILIIVGAVVIGIQGGGAGWSFSFPALLVLAACTFWGIDNNLTRDIEELNPAVLASFKGLTAGAFNTLLAVYLTPSSITLLQGSATLLIGALSYGLSLVLFVKALREIGSSRTSTYFASGPFIGMLISVALLGERPPFMHWAAAALTLAGIWILFHESHEHVHTHEELTHSHLHVHDLHHPHKHEGHEGPAPHEHTHTHTTMTHSHRHWPDIHHRHRHD